MGGCCAACAYRLRGGSRDGRRRLRFIALGGSSMFACLHGSGNLMALAFEFSPVVERSAPDTVTLDASGLDRLFGLPQDVAAAIARRAAETGVKANLALASNPDAAICAARGFTGIGIVPYGDEAKFLGDLPIIPPPAALIVA